MKNLIFALTMIAFGASLGWIAAPRGYSVTLHDGGVLRHATIAPISRTSLAPDALSLTGVGAAVDDIACDGVTGYCVSVVHAVGPSVGRIAVSGRVAP